MLKVSIEILDHYEDTSTSNKGTSNIAEIASLLPLNTFRRLISYSY